jgi:hypothetical protein
MSEVEIVEKLAHALAGKLEPAIPLSIDLWDTATIIAVLLEAGHFVILWENFRKW